jgi:hypothetical protein
MSLQGKIVVFTGKISKPRHEFQRIVEEHGGIAGLDVSSNTDYLVVGEKPGSKLFRADSLGIKTISEEDFMKLLEDETIQVESPREAHKHFWFRETVKEGGDVVKDCLCGAVLISHPNGKWEKHESRGVIEQARKIAHQHAIEEERLCYQRQEEARRKEKEIIDFIESLTPEQREELRRQNAESNPKYESP